MVDYKDLDKDTGLPKVWVETKEISLEEYRKKCEEERTKSTSIYTYLKPY